MALLRVTSYFACNFSVTDHILQVSVHMIVNCVSDTLINNLMKFTCSSVVTYSLTLKQTIKA